MNASARTLLVVAVALVLAAGACKESKPTETPADVKPSRPPTPSGTMSLQGYYTHAGTVGTFEDCMTGEQWRVANEGDNAALEEAYLESEVALGSPLLVTVEGGIDRRPLPDCDEVETMLIVARFVRAWPGETCSTDAVTAD
jgi:uncharacterized lipoprotein NlpE involved in copper resistance